MSFNKRTLLILLALPLIGTGNRCFDETELNPVFARRQAERCQRVRMQCAAGLALCAYQPADDPYEEREEEGYSTPRSDCKNVLLLGCANNPACLE